MTATRPTRTALLAAAALTAALAPVAEAAAPRPDTAQARAATPLLSCRVATSADDPVAFSPPLTFQARTTQLTGTLDLFDCTSPDGSQPDLDSGTLTLRATGRAGCNGATQITGTGTITWYDGAGEEAGTSSLQPVGSVDGYNPGDALLGGTVTDGLLAGARASGSATPTVDVDQCAEGGISTLNGSGTIRFLP
ncbi:hypothetical protein [Kitasatospora sp. CB01950]|uniref:hypothetical protein n=1 Tax=Kitasatospora sp. CB01950 TaxID=1703930 RepID=UPI00093C6A7C|nr:hypothetical protein [Kitasatospora sp. CB01950]OKJ13935.1 hypothetical protein AMK19_11275 [Kitasatospora sp. CB01950]